MPTAAVVCLALAMYHEARSEGVIGQLAVGQVVINRAASGDRRWPSSICAVVKQGGEKPLHKCQFSFYCDGKSDRPYESDLWADSLWNSNWMLNGYVTIHSLEKATCYHTTKVKPRWAKGLKGLKIESHIFYDC